MFQRLSPVANLNIDAVLVVTIRHVALLFSLLQQKFVLIEIVGS